MRKLFSIMAVLILVIMAAVAMAGPSDTYVLYPISADPCQNPSVAKSSAVISAVTNTLTEAVALTASKSIYICDLSTSLTGTTANETSFQLVSGTTTTFPCDTDQSSVTGLHKANSQAAGGTFHEGYGGTLWKAASGKALCTKTTGTNSVVTGTVTYVKQ